MKKTLFVLSCVVCIILSYTVFKLSAIPTRGAEKKSCNGYEIIEAGKGINCNGDFTKWLQTIPSTKKEEIFKVKAKRLFWEYKARNE